ncbi:MAG: alpha-2-macroglobulin family protein [Dehalococcoidia bacterium]
MIADGTTGDDGVARVDVKAADYVYPGYYVSTRQGEVVVLAGTNWTGSIGYPNVPYTFKPERYAGHLYTDRPIYRPGETVQIKGIVRADDDAHYSVPPDGEEFRLQINDEAGREVSNQEVSISDMGTFDTSLALSTEAGTGQYYGYLSYVVSRAAVSPEPSSPSPPAVETRQISYLQFKVAEFRKPEFEVEVTTDKDSYINGETIRASAQASLFFGAPLAGAKVDWQVTAQTYFFQSEEFARYRFGDYDNDRYYYEGPFYESQQLIRLQGTGVLDASGGLTVAVPADVASDATSQTFTFEATVTDQNGQIVGAFTGVPVHKGAFYAGIRPEEYVSVADEPSTVGLVTVDTEGQPAGDIPLSVTIYERTWRTVRERTSDGEQRYVSEAEDTLVRTLDARTGADGTGEITFTPGRSGEYRIVATGRDDAGNEIRTSASTWVSGGEYASWRIGNDDLIQLVADKDEYQPGDTAKVLVAAPFTGSVGLVTQERGRLISYELRDFATNSETIEIPITSEHIPNVYVSVALFKAPTAENPHPQAKYGVVELKVSTDEKVLDISIEPDRDQLGPREKVTYKIKTTNSRGEGVAAELSLALVDKSVLSLQDDFARPSLEAFWSRRPLGVLTASMFATSIDRANELTIDRLQGGGKGGGGGPGDQSRTFFPNTAYWDPDLRTDGDGEATVEVDLPDTLTTWRLTARGITRDTVTGEARDEIVTSKDVIVRPAVPRFLVADDRASLGAIVHNFTDAAHEFEVTISTEGVEVEGDTTQQVSIEAGADAIVRWETHVPPGRESVSLRFEAKDGDESDAVSLDLPVYAFVTPETAGTAGEVTDEASEAVEAPYYVRRDAGELTVRVSPSLAAGVNTALEYVDEYPWESAETTVSRFLPRLALHRAVEELELTDIDDGGGTEALVQRSLQRLYRNQNSDGGFGWWPSDESDAAMTAYVLIGFGEAKRAGYAVDAYVEENAVAYLTGQLDLLRDVAFPQYDLRAYMLYALGRSSHGDLGRTYALAEQRSSLSNTAKAWLAVAIGDAGGDESDVRINFLLSDLQAAAIPSATGNHWEEETYSAEVFGDSTQATAQVLQAFTRYQPDHPLVDGTLRWLMTARKDGAWESTHDTAVALVAITDFMIVRKDAQASFRYSVKLNGDGKLSGNAKKGEVHQEDAVVIPIEDLLDETVNELRFERSPGDAEGRLYYTAHLRYFTPAENVEALSRGIGVSHEYFAADAEGDVPIGEISLGEAVRVRVTLVAESDLNFLVLEDFLPAGLEPIDTTLKTTPAEFRRQLYEEQRRSYQVSKRYSPFSHTDIRDNRVALFARFVPKGVYEYTYFAQATTPGEFRVAPATVYEQYFPEVFGRSDGGLFTVRPAEEVSAPVAPSMRPVAAISLMGLPVDGVLPRRVAARRRLAGVLVS